MLARLSLSLAGLALAVGLVQPGFSRDKNAKAVTVSGCLAQGDHQNEYAITALGKTYGLRSSTVNLAGHLGHQVEITGNVTKEKEKAGHETKTGKPEEDAHMNVTSLKMISSTCQ